MDPEIDQRLCQKYPKLYAQRHLSMRETCMCWGFECSDGWESIIDNLSEKLEAMNNAGANIVAVQVKEKFGGLRFYVGGATDEAHDLIKAAEKLSYETCEVCGKPGKERGGGWVRTLCEECDTPKKG